MRIQHNIASMNAYRNYNNNTSALSKNLEKLSSGYKINRAGDDAAGLAISEKMRAQITGLNAAQKNVKDGVSLVKTAEGAMQEIHDMLNRMDYLATQSANGTYDNEVDRANLQKEVDALKSEINRIADSANFNGIKLLDGSLSKDGVTPVSSKFDLPDVGQILGKDTVLHQDEDESSASTAFGLELHNMTFTGAAGDSFTIKIGDGDDAVELVGELAEAGTITGEDMTNALTGADTSKVSFTVGGQALDPTKLTIGEDEFSIVAGETNPTSGEKTGVLFKMNGSKANVNTSYHVEIKANALAGDSITSGTVGGAVKGNAEIVPASGGVEGRGKTNNAANVKQYSATGSMVDKDAITFAKKDGVDKTAIDTTDPIANVVTGAATTNVALEGTNASYVVALNKAGIQAAADALGLDGVDPGAVKVTTDGTDLKLLDAGGNELGTLALNTVTTAGNGVNITDGSGNVVGTITATEKDGQAFTDATELTGDNVTVNDVKIASIKTATNTDLKTDAITAAAVAAGAGSGKITLEADGDKVVLKVGGTTVGTGAVDPNNTTELKFTAEDGTDLGFVTLGGNADLKAADLTGSIDTNLTYADANVKVTDRSTVDQTKLAAEVKKQLKTAGKELAAGEDVELSITFDGTNAKLMAGDTAIATGALNGSALEFKDSNNALMFSITLDGVTNLTDLANTEGHNNFEDIGLTVKAESVAKKTADSTALDAGEIAKKANTEGAANGDVTVSYNSGSSKYELKIGDKVLAEDAGTFNTGTGELSLNFGAMGSVKVTDLAADFTGEDLDADTPIETGLTFNATANDPITANFTGLNTAKLAEKAEDLTLDDGTSVQVTYDSAANTWSLGFEGETALKTGIAADADGNVDFGEYGKITVSDAITAANTTDLGVTANTTAIDTGLTYGTTSTKSGLTGDYLVTTSDQQSTNKMPGDRLASTVLNLKDSMVTDGASIFVAGKNYTFSTGKDTVVGKDAVKVDISDLDPEADNYLSSVAKRLTDAYAADNTHVYTLGWDGKNITVTETKTHGKLDPNGVGENYADDGWDLRTMDGIAKSLGYSTAAVNGKALTLQIGDTSDDFNQMKVSVGDMHTTAMGTEGGEKISDVDISTQEGAAKAVDVIKNAINYVSSVRGDLGAIQNRLEHTGNNLSVMAENIQDAESTIRDTDVAEEMMSYVKNNILVQSAQAMLAQANQLPQGVLQLLG